MTYTKHSPLIAGDFLDGVPERGCHFGGGSGGGGGSQPTAYTTTTSSSQPWGQQIPYLTDVMEQAKWYEHNYNPSYYPGSTVAALTAPQQQAINLEQSTGLSNLNDPGSVANATGRQISDTASGAYLPGGSAFNPFFDNLQKNVLSTVVPGLEAQFNQGNSMNNPGAARAVSMGATDALGNIAAQMYEAERNNQLKAAGLAPQTQGLQYQNIGALSDAGAQLQNQQQQQIADAVARWNYQQQLPYQQLNNYAGLVGGNYGGTTTVQQPYFVNRGANALGGALGGGMLGGMLGPSLGIPSGYGAFGGAGIGGLLPFL